MSFKFRLAFRFVLHRGVLCLTVLFPHALFSQAPGPRLLPSHPAPAATNAETTLGAAKTLANTGRGSEALRQLDSLASASPNTPGLEKARGLAYYSLDQLKEADAAFANALIKDPHDVEAAQMRGLTLFRLGRPADAIPLLESAPGVAAQSKADPSYVLALCYIDAKRYDDARHAFASQYAFQPDSAAAYLLAARMLFRRESLPIAQRFASKAVELEPQLPLANELLGEVALAGNHFEEAAAFFEKERARDPLQPSVYERLGDTYSRAAKYPEARRELQRAVLLEPNSTGPYILLGKVTLKENDPIAALTYLRRAEQMDPSNYITHNLLAQTYRSLGRMDEAAKELQLTQKTQDANAPKLTTLQ